MLGVCVTGDDSLETLLEVTGDNGRVELPLEDPVPPLGATFKADSATNGLYCQSWIEPVPVSPDLEELFKRQLIVEML